MIYGCYGYIALKYQDGVDILADRQTKLEEDQGGY